MSRKTTGIVRLKGRTLGELVPMPHGGALRAGGTNKGGPGRPPAVLRLKSRAAFERLPRELVASEAEAGTDHLAACALRLRRASRRTYLPCVRETFPELAASYERAYGRAAYASDTYRDGLSTFMKRLCRQHGSGWREGRDDAFASVVSVVDAPVRATPWELPLSRAALAELS